MGSTTKSLPVVAPHLCKGAHTDQPGSLTFITSEGESITFPDLELPPGEAAAIAGEDALSKIWNRPAEDMAWHDM